MRSKYNFTTTDERSRLMSKIKSNNTKAEILIRKALWKKNIRFRINNKSLFGKPDITIKKYKLVVFIDGEFWHGYNWEEKKLKIKANRDYWIPKIERNMRRDYEVNNHYAEHGWKVFRFWEKQVKKSFNECLQEILLYIQSIQLSN